MCRISPARSRSCPPRQAVFNKFDRKMCSRLRTGSASMPIKASKPETADDMRSASASPSAINSAGGARNDSSTLMGMPALEPGV